ncbi:hypothetical protein Tco_0697718 [Tanacetum coccineum]
MIKLKTFAVMCKAYGGEPSVDLLRAFLNHGPNGNWLILSNRVPSKYSELLLEDNKLDKKSFKDVLPTYARDDPLYRQISTYPCNVRTFPDPILYLAGLKTSWKHSPKIPIIYYHGREMDFRSFMMEGINGEFHFIPEGGVGDEGSSPSTRFVNNEALTIDAEPLTDVYPSEFAENIGDSDDAPSEQDEKIRKVSPQARKVAGDASDPLDVDCDPDIHEISLEKLCEIHDKAYMRHAVLDNMLNNRTRKLMSTLSKDRDSCDVIWERERQVDRLHDEYSRLVLKEKKWVKYEKTLSILCSKVEAERERLKSSETQLLDEMGLLVARLVKAAMFHGRCTDFEEVYNFQRGSFFKKSLDLEKISGYRSSSKKEFDQAGDNLATTSYPSIAEATADPYASLEKLLSKKPKSLRTKPAPVKTPTFIFKSSS